MSAWDRVAGIFIRFRWIALALAAGVTVASAFAALKIPFTSGVAEYLPENVPEVRTWLELSRRFDAFNALLVGLEEPGPSMSIDGLTRLRRITHALEEMKGSGVLAARSLANIESMRVGDDGTINTELLIPAIPTDQPGLEAAKKKVLDDLQILGVLVSRDLRGYTLLVRADPRKDSSAVARTIEQAVEKDRGPLKAYYFGAPFFTAMIYKHVYAHLFWIAPLFALLLLGVLAAGLRQPAVIAVVLGSTGVALVWWLGLVHVFGLGLSQTSANAALVLVGIGVVAYARGLEARLHGETPTAFPWAEASALTAAGLACAALTKLDVLYLATFGAVTAAGVLAIFAFGLLAFAPLASFLAPAPVPPPVPRRLSVVGVVLSVAVIAGGGYIASGARFLTTPQTMFSEKDEVGQSLAFFDARFGGTDFVQVGFKGDMRNPAVAARLLRLTDLLEGSRTFADTRSVAQVLGFLNHGFGGVYRIPSSRESLANIWFFLEGSGDVRNLVSDKRDEAMITLRIPSRPTAKMSDLVGAVNSAVATSASRDLPAERARFEALARTFGVDIPPQRIDALLMAVGHAPNAAEGAQLDLSVLASLHTFVASSDSPYQPSETEWPTLATALTGGGDVAARVAVAALAMEGLKGSKMAGPFVDTLLSREKELRLNATARMLAERLYQGIPSPEAFQERVRGAVLDLLDPAPGNGDATVTVTGFPVVASAIEADLKTGLWRALGILLGLGAVALLVLTWKPALVVRGLLEAALATAATLVIARGFGVEIDSGSATLYLMPAVVGFLASGWASRASRQFPVVFLAALAASGLSLLFTGALPVTRIGAVMSIGLACVALVSTWICKSTTTSR